ncbi:MAG: hypothetical protein LBE78_03905 [Burkholderiaceae bacterium]|nr:hypothetical protein [Burkholderiaceae bacterium]
MASFQRSFMVMGNQMIKLLKGSYFILAHLFYFLGFMVFVTTSTNKYAWMADIDPSIEVPPDPSGNRIAIFTVLLFLMIATQFVIVIAAKKIWIKITSALFIFLIITIWIIKILAR